MPNFVLSMEKKGKILVVDDNQGIRSALGLLLPPHFAQVELIPSPTTLVSTLESFRPDVVLLDMNFYTDANTGNEGLYWTSQIRQMAPGTEVVLFTAYADIQLAVEGMRRGAFDFIVKPWDNDKLIGTLSAARDKALKGRKGSGSPSSAGGPSFAGQTGESPMYWGDSPAMEIIRRNVAKIAPTDATVLITGANGTGKDVLAGEIHARSRRAAQPLVAVDAGAIPETLFESELFGHVKGAFPDAHADHVGKFEQADGGTLFLDEIGNIPLHLQAKLLRAIQNRSITRLGDTQARPVDIRLICATNMDLEALVREGRFREDLYYRINTVHLRLPSLKDRPDDILPLARLFLERFADKYHRPVAGLTEAAEDLLRAHDWSGNIRELQNSIEKAVILSDGETIGAGDLQFDTLRQPEGKAGAGGPETLEMAEERMIREAMARFGGNLTAVAKALNISRPTLYKKLGKYNI